MITWSELLAPLFLAWLIVKGCISSWHRCQWRHRLTHFETSFIYWIGWDHSCNLRSYSLWLAWWLVYVWMCVVTNYLNATDRLCQSRTTTQELHVYFCRVPKKNLLHGMLLAWLQLKFVQVSTFLVYFTLSSSPQDVKRFHRTIRLTFSPDVQLQIAVKKWQSCKRPNCNRPTSTRSFLSRFVAHNVTVQLTCHVLC